MATRIIGVVNQHPDNLELLQQALKVEGYAMLFVPEGPEAHTVIKSSQPDLVLLDTRSEDADSGWHLVQELRLDIQTAKIPLLILSSEDPGKAEAKAPALARHQRVELVPAPFDPAVLVGKIKRMLADRPQ